MSGASQELDQVNVTGKRPDKLTQEAVSASRLGLTPLETPATIDIIGAQTMAIRGYAQVEDAVDSMPGVTSGGSPGDPTGFSMRGFTGDQVTVLRNGAYLGPSNMINRPQNSFNLQDVEVLKGPASVLYGQGAVGGIVNVITKDPTFGPATFNSMVSGGSFGTVNFGVAGNTRIGNDAAIRLDVSRTASDGFIKNDNPDVFNATSTAIWHIRDDLSLKVIMDYMHDDLESYYGTPLVTTAFATDQANGIVTSTQGLTLDQRMLKNNYNVADSEHYGTYLWPTAILSWQPTDWITVSNETYMYYASRKWQNAETYTFLGPNSGATDAEGNPIPANQIGRDRFYVYHEQHDFGDLLDANFDYEVFGLKNRTTAGIDLLDLNFRRASGFPNAQYADYVDPINPVQGSYGSFPGELPENESPTYMQNIAGLFEDALDLTSQLKLVTGARKEWLRVDRQYYNADGSENPTTSFTRVFEPFSYRAGLVYAVKPTFTFYGLWTTATDPPGSNVFIANASQLQTLTKSKQIEVGSKAVFLDGRADMTLSLYDIHRANILVSTGPDTVADAGSQHSRGIEFSSDVRVTHQWSLSGNAAWTYSRYGQFVDPNSGTDATGNKPPDVPSLTANFWTQYSSVFSLPLDPGLGIRYVSTRAGNYGNTLSLDNYTTVNIYGIYHVTKNVEFTGRVDNLFNKQYAQWADVNYPTEVVLGRPRYFEAQLTAHF